MEFKFFTNLVRKQFKSMSKSGQLFVVNSSKDEIWDCYLNSFPIGTNPIYKERREYDCQICKSFIRQAGHIVAIKNNKLITIWDITINDPTFQTVANAMAEYVKSCTIDTIFLSSESIGVESNKQQLENGEILTWNHFSIKVPNENIGTNIGTDAGKARSKTEVLYRSLKELTLESAEIVLELIEQGSLYRGEEHKDSIKKFMNDKKNFDKIPKSKQMIYCWTLTNSFGIRNTVIGSLLVDICNGVELDDAVKMFENKVAPQNYKRPTALITKSMIEKAQKKCAELGYEPSLYTRCAVSEDITINNVLFADRSVKPAMGVNAFDILKNDINDIKGTKNLDKIEEVSIENFVETILPKAESIELLFENKHENNLMTLLAPVNSDAPNMLKWNNNFRWSYNGEVADSIKQRVKKMGGNTNGVLRFSIMWNDGDNNQNDFDAHAYEPNGNKITFMNKCVRHKSSGMLDVDIRYPKSESPDGPAVENIVYTNIDNMPDGDYNFVVHNFKHNGGMTGFNAEIEFDGQIYNFVYNKNLKHDDKVSVATVNKSKKDGFKIVTSLESTVKTKQIYGISTNKFHKVTMMMYSPNHWDGEQRGNGNKHYFFILKDCKNNNESVRGFYNEFLKEDLNEHRKVFEMLASKIKAEPTDNQLSGLGFSSTKRDIIICNITGTFNRKIKITF